MRCDDGFELEDVYFIGNVWSGVRAGFGYLKHLRSVSWVLRELEEMSFLLLI